MVLKMHMICMFMIKKIGGVALSVYGYRILSKDAFHMQHITAVGNAALALSWVDVDLTHGL